MMLAELVYRWECLMIGSYTILVQTEMSQHLLDGLLEGF